MLMLSKLVAACLLCLTVSPFTAPFSTCDLAAMFGHTSQSMPGAPVGSPTTAVSRETSTSLIPSVTTTARIRLIALEGRRFSSASADSQPARNRAEQSSHLVVARSALSTILRL